MDTNAYSHRHRNSPLDITALKKERGMRLTAARRRRNLSAEDLAVKVCARRRISITRSAVFAWEKGRNLLREKVAVELARVLDCTVQDLLGPAQTFDANTIENEVLETIPLGGLATQPSAEIAHQSARTKSLQFEVLVHQGDKAKPLIQRSWQLTYDNAKKRFIIRTRHGTSPFGLVLAEPQNDGARELPATLDPLDYNTARVAWDDTTFETTVPEEPVLLWRTNFDAIRWCDVMDWFKQQSRGNQSSGRNASRRISTDIEAELTDFVDHDTAVRLCSLWEEGSGYLERYRSEVLPKEIDPYRQCLIHALILTTLQKNHELARSVLDDLLSLTGRKPSQRADARYLSGRNWWYLKQDRDGKSLLPRAIEDLALSYRYAREAENELRQSQCLIFLARIAADFPSLEPEIVKQTQLDVDKMWLFASDVGKRTNRPDVAFLAERIQLILLHNQKQYPAEVQAARELLAALKRQRDIGLGFDLRHIEDAVRLQLGIALRRIKTESALLEAEQVYQDGIDRQRDDSHAGICAYLTGDLYADRAEIAVQETATAMRISQCYLDAQKWYDRALALLEGKGDRLALQKCRYRSLWIRQQELPSAITSQVVVDSQVPRTHEITRKLMGSSYAKSTERIPKTLLEEIISIRNLSPSQSDEEFLIDIDDYIDAQTLVVLPWATGGVLAIQLFTEDTRDPDELILLGWVYLRNYVDQIRPLLQKLQAATATEWTDDSWTEYRSLLDLVWSSLQAAIEVIVPVRLPAERKGRIIVIAPDDPLDGLIPFESLVKVAEDDFSLLDEVLGSILYAGRWGAPKKSSRLSGTVDEIAVFASHAPLSASTSSRLSNQVHNLPLDKVLAARTTFSVRRLPAMGARIKESTVVIVAHDDQRGELRERIRSWHFEGTKTVLLMFCGSGSYELVRGPFIDGAAYNIRKGLGPAGLVLANRLPVSVAEVIRILKFLHTRLSPSEPFAKTITDYLKSEDLAGRNPFLFPWILL